MENSEKFGKTDFSMLLAVLIWAVNFSLIKVALTEFSPMAFNGIRMVFASAILIFFLLSTKKGLRVPRKDLGKLVVLGIIGNAVYQLLFIHGINLTTASNTSIIMAMTPASVALLSTLCKHEKIHWAAWLGIALSFVGFAMVITNQPGEIVLSWKNLRGDILIFMGNFAWAVYTVFSKPILDRVTPLKWSSLTLAAGTVFFVPFCFPAFMRQDFGRISLKAWAILAFSGIFALAVNYVIWYMSVKKIGNSKTVIYGNILPIFTVIFASLLIAERIGLWQAAGALIILLGVYLARSGFRFFSVKAN
jgi:drug/metabolite transporter (DMT)-like permease